MPPLQGTPGAYYTAPARRRRRRRRHDSGTPPTPAPGADQVLEEMPPPPPPLPPPTLPQCAPSTSAAPAAGPSVSLHDEPREDPGEEYERLKRRIQLGIKLATDSELVSRVAEFLGIKSFDYDSCFLKDEAVRAHFLINKPGRIRYSWIACFRLGVVLTLQETFPHIINSIEVVDPTIDNLERQLLVELDCTFNVSVEQPHVIDKPTLLSMPYPDPVFFENLLRENWSVDRLRNLVVIGYSFNAMADFIEMNIRFQKAHGLKEQCRKVGRIQAIRHCVEEIRTCREIDGIQYHHFTQEGQGHCSPAQISAFKERIRALLKKDNRKRVHVIPYPEWAQKDLRLAGCALPYMFSVYFFGVKKETDLTSDAPYGLSERFLSTINIELQHQHQELSYLHHHDTVHIEDKDLKEANRLSEEIRDTMTLIGESSMYHDFCSFMLSDQRHTDNIQRVLGHHDDIQMVIYAFNSIEFSVSARYQLAFALLLVDNGVFHIGEIEIYGSALTPADVQACLDLDIKVLLVDEQCRRMVERPTFFLFLGSCLRISWLGNLYESNFSAQQLNQMIVGHFTGDTISEPLKRLDNLFKEHGDGVILHGGQLDQERGRYVLAAGRHSAGVIENGQQHRIWTGIRQFQFEFFHVPSGANLRSSLQRVTNAESFLSDFEMDMQYTLHLASDCVAEYRSWQNFYTSLPFNNALVPCKPFFDYPGGWCDLFREGPPARYQRHWSPPPSGWIKLNFHGVGSTKGRKASFGLVFHNDKGEEISYYSAPLGDNVDCATANVEALRQGLKWMIAYHDPVRKLIIESDDRRAIHWLNAIFPPPVELLEQILEVFVLASRIPSKSRNRPWLQREYIACHIDKNTNERAIHLANVAGWLKEEYFDLDSSCRVAHTEFDKTTLVMPSWFRAKEKTSRKGKELIPPNGAHNDEKLDYVTEMLAKLVFWGKPNPSCQHARAPPRIDRYIHAHFSYLMYIVQPVCSPGNILCPLRNVPPCCLYFLTQLNEDVRCDPCLHRLYSNSVLMPCK